MPEPTAIDRSRTWSTPDVGDVGDRAPPCAVRHYGSLADWLGPKPSGFSPDTLKLRLFECRQKFLLVVPGIQNAEESTGKAADESETPASSGEA
jgi:hypothetical protein